MNKLDLSYMCFAPTVVTCSSNQVPRFEVLKGSGNKPPVRITEFLDCPKSVILNN
jgi:hypothetical protein